jgi:group I intron endonuclease
MSNDKEWCVYMHTNNINNKKYIGMTCDVSSRFEKNGEGYLHKNKEGKYTQPAFAYAINKYGWDNFTHKIIKDNLLKEEADELEIKMIKEYDTQNPNKGYNIRNGGSNGHLSEETKKKLRETMTGRYDGENNPFYGKQHSQETKDILRQKGKENARDISGDKNPMYGKTLNEEERYHRGDGRRNTHLSEETKNKISESNKEYYKTHIHHALGTHKTEYQKKVLRQKMLGREMDDQWKEKIGRGHAPYAYLCVETNCEYYSSGEAERQTGIDKSSIRKAADGKQNVAGGYHWKKIIK